MMKTASAQSGQRWCVRPSDKQHQSPSQSIVPASGWPLLEQLPSGASQPENMSNADLTLSVVKEGVGHKPSGSWSVGGVKPQARADKVDSFIA